jgi:hypothetical protein
MFAGISASENDEEGRRTAGEASINLEINEKKEKKKKNQTEGGGAR